MPARCSRPDNLTFSVFTCPTQRVLISRWMPVRCSRPDNPTFQTCCATYPSNTAILKPQSDVGESLRTDKLSFSILRPARPTQPRCRSTARPSDHLTLPFCLNPSDSGSPDLPTDGGENSPGQTISSFQVHARRGLPVRHGGY